MTEQELKEITNTPMREIAYVQICKLIAEVRRLREENGKLTKFFRTAMEYAFDGCDWFGGDIQDDAVAFGLAHWEVYDPEKHADLGDFEGDAGDQILIIGVANGGAECLSR